MFRWFYENFLTCWENEKTRVDWSNWFATGNFNCFYAKMSPLRNEFVKFYSCIFDARPRFDVSRRCVYQFRKTVKNKTITFLISYYTRFDVFQSKSRNLIHFFYRKSSSIITVITDLDEIDMLLARMRLSEW